MNYLDDGRHTFKVVLDDDIRVSSPNYHFINFDVNYVDLDPQKIFKLDISKMSKKITFDSLDVKCLDYKTNSTVVKFLCKKY